MTELVRLRVDLAERSKWNVGYFAAGLLYWTFAAVAGATLPLQVAKLYWALGTGVIFPAALLFSRLLRSDPFTSGNALADLIGLTHLSLLALTMPVLVMCFVDLPQGLPLAAAVFFGASFPVLFWAFGDALFLVHAVVRVAGATWLWFAFPDGRATAVPAFVAVMYLLTLVAIPLRRRAWLRVHSPGRAGAG